MLDTRLPHPRPGALIFDCDGTLADTMPTHYQAWQRTLAPLGAVFPLERFYGLAGVPTPTIAGLLASEYGLAVAAGELARRKEAAYLEMVETVQPFAEVVALAAAARGVLPMAVASGSHRSLVLGTLGAIGITDWFGAIVAAEDTARHKPEPDVFLEAARRLGVLPPACLVLEDADLGLEAARRAGMRAIDVRVAPWR